jgi:hypothetical protein
MFKRLLQSLRNCFSRSSQASPKEARPGDATTMARLARIKNKPAIRDIAEIKESNSECRTAAVDTNIEAGHPSASHTGLKSRLLARNETEQRREHDPPTLASTTLQKLRTVSRDERTVSAANRKLQELLEIGCEHFSDGK